METIYGVLLASGGMDSTVLAYKLNDEQKNFIPLFLNYGQHFAEKEFSTLQKVLPSKYKELIKVINISDIYKDSKSIMIKETNLWTTNVSSEDLYLPYRNLLFLTVAASYAQTIGVKRVFSAFINSNHAKEIDCSKKYFDMINELFLNISNVEIIMPFRDMSKLEVAKLGLSLNVDISQTYSCQVNSQNPCGACPNCVDRLNALNALIEGDKIG